MDEAGRLQGQRTRAARVVENGLRQAHVGCGELALELSQQRQFGREVLIAGHLRRPDYSRPAREDLRRRSGKDFDLRYVAAQIKDHQKSAQLLIHEIASGQHTGVRQFAADTLPKVMGHLERAKELHAELTGAAPPKGPAAP